MGIKSTNKMKKINELFPDYYHIQIAASPYAMVKNKTSDITYDESDKALSYTDNTHLEHVITTFMNAVEKKFNELSNTIKPYDIKIEQFNRPLGANNNPVHFNMVLTNETNEKHIIHCEIESYYYMDNPNDIAMNVSFDYAHYQIEMKCIPIWNWV